MKKWRASAPANIALIKYMGKASIAQNRATNRSLSWTLNHLLTTVEMEEARQDEWAPLSPDLKLSQAGQVRFLKHLGRIKEFLGYKGFFKVSSGNNFPSDCGLASSASSFAALTVCAYQAIFDLQGEKVDLDAPATKKILSQLSRQGSGSSCRSFFSPWALWSEDEAHAVDLPGHDFLHQVIIVDQTVKDVSSSQAHRLVAESALFEGRITRAERRLEDLMASLRAGDWKRSFQITWAEFWDMHALFETCPEPFGYITDRSMFVLQTLRDVWRKEGDGPIVTMDAGPNVHLLYRADQKALFNNLRARFEPAMRVIANDAPVGG